MYNVFIGLGSNKGDRLGNLKDALKAMTKKGLKPIKTSFVYETLPFGIDTVSKFYNACVLVETFLEPIALLDILENIEEALGRKKEDKGKYVDRIIDLDILFFDDLIINNERLTIPHRFIGQREFVLLPLIDIASEFIHPEAEKSISEIYSKLSEKNSCIKIEVEGL